MGNILNISPAPHVFGKDTTRSLMLDVIIALSPALVASIYFFGYGAIIVTLTSVVSCLLFEYLIQRFILLDSLIDCKCSTDILNNHANVDRKPSMRYFPVYE